MLAHIEVIARCSRPALRRKAGLRSLRVVKTISIQNRHKGTLQKPVKTQKEMIEELGKYISSREHDKDGYFIRKPNYTGKDFENSSFMKYMRQADKEGLQLVDEKLQLLAKASGVPVEELQQKLTEKVSMRLDEIKNSNKSVLNTIEDFKKNLGSIAESKSNVVDDILASLRYYGEQFEDSELFEYLSHVDEKFADLVSETMKMENASPASVAKLQSYADGGSPISRLSEKQVKVLANLIHYGKADVDETISGSGNSEMRKFTEEREKNIKDTTQLVRAMLAHFNAAPTLESSPLFRFFRKIDFKFSELISGYSNIDTEDTEALEAFFKRLVQYAANKSTPLRTVLDDKTSETYQKFQSLTEAPLPISLGDIYECLDARRDVSSSPVFVELQRVDPKFATLLQKRAGESMQSDASIGANQIEDYLKDEKNAICQALADVDCQDYRLLRGAVAKEQKLLEKRVSAKAMAEVLLQKGTDSEEFRLVATIDPEFGRAVQPLLGKMRDGDAAERAETIVASIDADPASAIYQALHNVDDEHWGSLVEAVQPDVSPSDRKNAEAGMSEKLDSAEMQKFKQEDQSALDSDVVGINNAYELVFQALDNLTREIRENQMDPVGPSVVERVAKLLRLNPSEQQKQEAEEILDLPQPSHKDEVLELCVNLIMKNGKKDQARKFVNRALYLIYLKTRSNPVDILKSALDTAAPLVITKTVKTGFAKNFIVPVPLTSRQRNRMAFLWILDSSDSRASNDFSVRLAEEILNVSEGNSRIMEKKALSHKLAIANRSYLRI